MGQATESESCKLKDCGKIRLNDVSKNKNIALSINNDVILNHFHRQFYDFVVSESCDDNIQNQDEEEIDCGGVCCPCPISKSINF